MVDVGLQGRGEGEGLVEFRGDKQTGRVGGPGGAACCEEDNRCIGKQPTPILEDEFEGRVLQGDDQIEPLIFVSRVYEITEASLVLLVWKSRKVNVLAVVVDGFP